MGLLAAEILFLSSATQASTEGDAGGLLQHSPRHTRPPVHTVPSTAHQRHKRCFKMALAGCCWCQTPLHLYSQWHWVGADWYRGWEDLGGLTVRPVPPLTTYVGHV